MVFCYSKSVLSWSYGTGKRNHKQETVRMRDSGSWSPQWDSPALQRTITASLSSVDGVKPCLFPASLIFSSWVECTLCHFSNLSLLYAAALFYLFLSLSPLWPQHHDNFMLFLSRSPFAMDLGNAWISCQPARVENATLKLQLCKLVSRESWTQGWVPFSGPSHLSGWRE